MKQLKARFYYFLSFFKSNWTFEDYPLEAWTNSNAEEDDIRYGAKFTNWETFIAHGSSSVEAISNLRDNFTKYRKENELPRPGSKVPIQFAETDRIDEHEEIAVDFFDKIVGISYYDCFISDMSSLLDFDINRDEAIEKIKKEYGIEPHQDLIFVDVFEQIKNKARA